MKRRAIFLAVLGPVFLAGVIVTAAHAANTTLAGKVSDAMCGASHMMAGSEAACAHECVKGGSKYALVVGDKVYTLETSDKATLDKLGELAGSNARVTGEVKGDSIVVKSVSAGS